MSPEQLEELKELNSYYNNLLLLGETSFIYNGYEVQKKRYGENSEAKWVLSNIPKVKSEEVTIPFFIQVIGAFTFHSQYNHKLIERIEIPEGIEIIEDRAFNGCHLMAVSLPNTLRRIGEYAFACCKLEELYVPDNVETIGRCGFLKNNDLRKISLPSGILLGHKAFGNCGSNLFFSADLSLEVRQKGENPDEIILSKGILFGDSPFERKARKYTVYKY